LTDKTSLASVVRSAGRLVVVGGGSFIAGHVKRAARQAGLDVVAVAHGAPLAELLRAGDTVLNCSWNPALNREPYAVETDSGFQAAQACRAAGTPFIMLSTRRVYPAEARWNATEAGPSGGDETVYGRNKAVAERRMLDLLGSDATILRLSNIFGSEFDPDRRRGTFFALALTSLRDRNCILFDVNPDARRDFLPVERCAEAIVACIGERGIFNLGSGFPTACRDIADWILEGYGRGKIEVTSDVVRDEFFLNMDKWGSRFGTLIDEGQLRRRCLDLGSELARSTR
jgi:nucleoside-diphosphate-sugar epimerase